MKRIILLIAFCLSLSVIYAQTIDVIHLKNGFDARGTITNRSESQITLQSENGRTLTIDMSEIESMEQEQKAFDPRVLIGRWACYKANGDRDERYDMVISENEGFYTANYDDLVIYSSDDNSLCCYNFHYNCAPAKSAKNSVDITADKGDVCFRFNRCEESWINVNSNKERVAKTIRLSSDIDLKYIEGKLKGSINCLNYYDAEGNVGYRFVQEALDAGRGLIIWDGPKGKWNVYFVKY